MLKRTQEVIEKKDSDLSRRGFWAQSCTEFPGRGRPVVKAIPRAGEEESGEILGADAVENLQSSRIESPITSKVSPWMRGPDELIVLHDTIIGSTKARELTSRGAMQ